jgi:hypothetical protein
MTMDGRSGGARSNVPADAGTIVDPISASDAHAKVVARPFSD